jgi:hypothetical protein
VVRRARAADEMDPAVVRSAARQILELALAGNTAGLRDVLDGLDAPPAALFAAQTPEGARAVHVVAYQGDTAALRVLLAAGARRDVRMRPSGHTPLHLACQVGRGYMTPRKDLAAEQRRVTCHPYNNICTRARVSELPRRDDRAAAARGRALAPRAARWRAVDGRRRRRRRRQRQRW